MMLTVEDLAPIIGDVDYAVVQVYIDDVWAQAVNVAPCLAEVTFPPEKQAVARSILRQAALRWWRAGEGGVTTEQNTAGPFSHSLTYDRTVRGEGRLFDGEIRRLQKLCPAVTTSRRKAFTIQPRLG